MRAWSPTWLDSDLTTVIEIPLASLDGSQFRLPVTQWGRLLEKAWSAPARAMSRVYDAVTRLYHGAPASGSPW